VCPDAMPKLTRNVDRATGLALVDPAKLFAVLERGIGRAPSNPEVIRNAIAQPRDSARPEIASGLCYLRKSIAASRIHAEKKIMYMLLDSVAGLPGHLGRLYESKCREALATRIEHRFGAVAAHYWRQRYCGPDTRSETNTKRLIAALKKVDLIRVTHRGPKSALYQLQHAGNNDVLACCPSWLQPFFEGRRSALEIMTLMMLHSHAGQLGCFPSQATLMREIGASRASIQRALRSLELAYAISRNSRRGKDGRWHNSYILSDKYPKPARSHLTPVTTKARSDLMPDNQVRFYNQGRGSVRETTGIVEPGAVRPPNSAQNPLRHGSVWPEELTPLLRALEEHARATGTFNDLQRDSWLANQFLQMTQGDLQKIRSVAAFIAKESLRRFSRAPDRFKKPWPHRLGYWLTACRGYLGNEVDGPRPETINRDRSSGDQTSVSKATIDSRFG
jgi:hypothetical protein